jgi:SPASM domain peptide maturase of grasp-with-spasm system
MNENLYFCLIASCKIVLGSDVSAVYDLQTEIVHTYPKWVGEFVTLYEGQAVIRDIYSDSDFSREEVLTVIQSLVARKCIVLTKWPHFFKTVHRDSVSGLDERPMKYAIVDIDRYSNLDIHGLFLEEHIRHGGEVLDIRVYNYRDLDVVFKFISDPIFRDYKFVTLYINLNPLEVEQYRVIDSSENISMSNCFILEEVGNFDGFLKTNFYLGEFNVNSCGIVSRDNFTVNSDNFKKAKLVNECLFGKIGVDVNGKLKNCPSHDVDFGVYSKGRLVSLASDSSFLSYQKIKKDDVEICRDCIYRYCCTDCRVFVKDGSNSHGKPEKCGYDPYSNKWTEGENYFTPLFKME